MRQSSQVPHSSRSTPLFAGSVRNERASSTATQARPSKRPHEVIEIDSDSDSDSDALADDLQNKLEVARMREKRFKAAEERLI